jgi:hypothetical protein
MFLRNVGIAYKSTWCHNSERHHHLRHENLKSQKPRNSTQIVSGIRVDSAAVFIGDHLVRNTNLEQNYTFF